MSNLIETLQNLSVSAKVFVCLIALSVCLAVAFTIAFIVEACKKQKSANKILEEKQEEEAEEVNEIDLDQMLAKLEAATSQKQPAEEEVKAEPVVEVVEEEVIPEVVEEKEEVKEESVPTTIIINNTVEKGGPEFDYRVRLEKIKESQVKIERDLDKTNRAILKYERTIRRKDRNQKMLDKKALELTNLNLLMYSVTDIKNVDADKKARQEELTAHIAELKASIEDANNYVRENKEKYEHNVKLKEYLEKEQKRYNDEVKELEELIANGKFFDDNAPVTTTEVKVIEDAEEAAKIVEEAKASKKNGTDENK